MTTSNCKVWKQNYGYSKDLEAKLEANEGGLVFSTRFFYKNVLILIEIFITEIPIEINSLQKCFFTRFLQDQEKNHASSLTTIRIEASAHRYLFRTRSYAKAGWK